MKFTLPACLGMDQQLPVALRRAALCPACAGWTSGGLDLKRFMASARMREDGPIILTYRAKKKHSAPHARMDPIESYWHDHA